MIGARHGRISEQGHSGGKSGRGPGSAPVPEWRQVCNLRIATSETWKDKNTGERRERTEWHSVAIFSDGLIRIAQNYLKKGSKVYIEGKLQTRKWQDQNGQDRYSTEVVLQGFDGTLTMLDSAGGGQGGGGGGGRSGGGYGGGGGGGGPRELEGPSQDFNQDFEDEIPF
ncbi:MAG: single-stranded DNA-binding protein [Henriciella sp.]